MQNSREVKINLIGKPNVDFASKFLKWTFNGGRIIIAGTELVVLIALGYRFYLDRKIIDLHDQIKNDQIFIENQKQNETNYVSIQNRLANIKETEKNTDIKITIMNSILNSVASGNFSSSDLSIDQNTVKFEGVAFSIFTINLFIEEMKKNPNVSSISLDDFSSGPDGIQFQITIELKTEAPTETPKV